MLSLLLKLTDCTGLYITTVIRILVIIVVIVVPRLFHDVPAKLAKIDAVVETRGGDHVDEILGALRDKGFSVSVLAGTESNS